jgi:uncharacterized protein (DUF2141 family)
MKTRAFHSLLTFALCLLPSALGFAQVRDIVKPLTGTGIVSGVVMSDETPSKPVRRVHVMLASGVDVKLPATTITDDAGRFSFTAVAPGTYTLMAVRPGYLTTTYGAKKPGRAQGVPISVTAGQRVSDLLLKLLHGSVITGTVRQPNGKPAIGVSVSLMEVLSVNGQRRLNPVMQSGATTDDRGVYRAYGLAPGDYVVRAEQGLESRFELSPVRTVTAEEIEWAKRLGVAASSTAAAAPAPLSPPPPPGPAVAFAPVYYPNVVDASAASIVTLGVNEERSGVDITSVLVPTAIVSGQIFDADGRPAPRAQITFEPIGSSGGSMVDMIMSMSGSGMTRVNPDGTFASTSLSPGRYRLKARAAPPAPPAAPGAAAPGRAAAGQAFNLMGMFGGGGADQTLWAMEEISVEGRDISGMVLRLQPGMTVSGKVEFEKTGDKTPDPALVRISFSVDNGGAGNAMMDMMAGLMASKGAQAQKDGTFSVGGLAPGTYKPMFVPPGMMLPPPLMPLQPGGFVLKSAILNGKDIADLPLQVRPSEDITGLVVTFTDRVTEVSGTVQDQAGRPVAGYPIIIFSTDRAHWMTASRRVAEARPASDGTYKLLGLPAGEYFVSAVTDYEQNQLYDPAFLDQLVPTAFKISLTEGEKKKQDLKLAGG